MNPKILLIEDEFFISDLYKRILESAGFEVLTAIDGEIGLQMAKGVSPSLILLDIMLPKINGLQLLKLLKAESTTQNIPVVLITNLGQVEVIKEAYDLGAQGYLMKVRLKPEELVSYVKEFLANPNLKMDYQKLTFD